jgi:hypothetical protein
MTRTLWNELGPKWPKGYWDDWMYTFSQVLYTLDVTFSQVLYTLDVTFSHKSSTLGPKWPKGYWDDWIYTFSQVLYTAT